jgi:hypothetical protein
MENGNSKDIYDVNYHNKIYSFIVFIIFSIIVMYVIMVVIYWFVFYFFYDVNDHLIIDYLIEDKINKGNVTI